MKNDTEREEGRYEMGKRTIYGGKGANVPPEVRGMTEEQRLKSSEIPSSRDLITRRISKVRISVISSTLIISE